MKQIRITFALVFAIVISQNCNPIKVNLTDQPPKPDLIIRNISYETIQYQETGGGNRPRRAIGIPPDYEFHITVENKGAGEWWGDFYIKCDYFFSEGGRRLEADYHLINMEGIVLPFKETINVILPPKTLPSGVKRLLFTVNPAMQDSTQEQINHSEEFFYHNNSYEISF